jgi:nucleotide-binding universal stress UspA family protein
MTNPATVLIAVDDDEGGQRAAAAAAALFGPEAHYRFAHVARPIPMTPPGAYGPAGMAPVGFAPVDIGRDEGEIRESAASVASLAATEAGLPSATSVGLLGEPADALIDEATSCGAAAIVVSAHDRGWIERLFHHSVRSDIVRMSPVPVLVVPDPDPAP